MTGKKAEKVMLVDGHSLAYRAFFALPDTMTTVDGRQTNAVYGFLSMLLKVLADERPDALIVAFDGPRSELRRTAEFREYKAHRPTMPDELKKQMEMLADLLDTMKVPRVQVPGYEADDVLGTLALRTVAAGDEAVIVTGDRDALQLAADGIKVMMTGRGVTEVTAYGPGEVMERYGVPPERLPDVTGLKGDSSDNIPGVPGIGEKGALALVAEHGSLEGIYENLNTVKGDKKRAALEENREVAFMSRDLAVLETEVPIELEAGEASLGRWDRAEVLEKLEELEFKSLAGRFSELYGAGPAREPEKRATIDYTVVSGTAPIGEFEKGVEASGAVAVAVEVTGSGFCDVSAGHVALATGDRVMRARAGEDGDPAWEAAKRVLEGPSGKWMHDAKPSMQALAKLGCDTANLEFDIAVAAYLENPGIGTSSVDDLWEKNEDREVTIGGEVVTPSEQGSLLAMEGAGDEIAVHAARTFHLKGPLERKIEGYGMSPLLADIEMPLLEVMDGMERAGVALDTSVMEQLSSEAGDRMSALEEEIYRAAGHPFKIGSTKQLQQVLFEEMGLPPTKKTKTGYSTDSGVLEALRDEHPIAGLIIEYREYSKLKSTYYDVLPTLVCPGTGRVHASFNQMATATGRISSSGPNLQNIPIRTEVGRRIREGFVPREKSWKMLVADYSQIELRVLAHMSGDRKMVEAFLADEDIHRETASEVFGVSHDEVTPEMRRTAKVVNFGIVYGMGYYGLSSRLGISREQATEFIDMYFERYEGVKRYQRLCIDGAAEKGYAETLMGRRRYIPQLKSGNRQTREFGERLAVNTPLQGSAADIIKKAMVDVARAIVDRSMSSVMTMQIHDELVFDVPPDEADALMELVVGLMSSVVVLDVPLKVEAATVDNLGEVD